MATDFIVKINKEKIVSVQLARETAGMWTSVQREYTLCESYLEMPGD
jgi:hypothetical protein